MQSTSRSFPLSYDLLHNYFIPNFLLGEDTWNVQLDKVGYPVVLCAFRMVCKRFRDATYSSKIAGLIFSNFRNLSHDHKQTSGPSQMFRVIRQYGHSPVFIQWVVEQLHFPLRSDYCLPAAEGKFRSPLIDVISSFVVILRGPYCASRMDRAKVWAIYLAYEQKSSRQLRRRAEMGNAQRLLQS